MITKQDEEKLGDFFAKAFHEVVAPEIIEIKQRLTSVENGVDSLNRKFDAAYERADRHGKQLENHEGRISRLETKKVLVS